MSEDWVKRRNEEADRRGLNRHRPRLPDNVRRTREKMVFCAAYSDQEARERSASAAETFEIGLGTMLEIVEAKEDRDDALRTFAGRGGQAMKEAAKGWQRHAKPRAQQLLAQESSATLSSLANLIAREIKDSLKLDRPPRPNTVRAYLSRLLKEGELKRLS